MNSRRFKGLALLLTFAFFFIYANVTAGNMEHSASVSILPDDKLLPVLIKDIAESKNSIYIAMYMFKSYDNTKNGAGLIKQSLIKAAKRGVQVHVAMDRTGENDFVDKENKRIGNELKKYNIKVIYDDKEIRMHTKCIVLDERITYIGSHNYTNSALKYNRELTVRIVSHEAAADAVEHIKSIK